MIKKETVKGSENETETDNVIVIEEKTGTEMIEGTEIEEMIETGGMTGTEMTETGTEEETGEELHLETEENQLLVQLLPLSEKLKKNQVCYYLLIQD